MTTTPVVAPSAGAQTGSSGAAPAPSAAPSQATDEQILGITPGGDSQPAEPEAVPSTGEPGASGEAPTGAQPATQPTTDQKTDQQIEQELQVDGRSVPQAWRDAIKANPALRDPLYTLVAYRQIPGFETVAKARETAELLQKLAPNGPAQAAEVAADLEEMRSVDAGYFSAKPEAQKSVAEGLFEQSPAALVSMFRVTSDVLQHRAPEQYREFRAEMLRGTLADLGFEDYALRLQQALETNNEEAVAGLLTGEGGLLPWLERLGFGAKPEDKLAAEKAKLTRDTEALSQQQQEWKQQREAAFIQTASEATGRQAFQHIQELVVKAQPDISDQAQASLAEKIYTKLELTLRADKDAVAHVTALIQQHGFTEEGRKQVEAYVFNRTKALAPSVAKEVLAQELGLVRNFFKQKQDKEKQAGERRDVTGAGHSGPSMPRAPTKVDYSKVSDEEILNN